MPPPRLSCPKIGKPEKNGMSHCTALLKITVWDFSKIKKEMKFVQNSFAKVFFHPKNVYDNPQISWRTYVTLYGIGLLLHCTAIAVFDVMIWWCNHILKWSHICSKNGTEWQNNISPSKTNIWGFISSIQIHIVFFRTVWHTFRKPNFWGFSYNQREDLDYSIKICNT